MAEPYKVRYRDYSNPFAHIEAQRKAAEDKQKAEIEARAKKQRETRREEVRTKSWLDYPFDAMRAVGNYVRGVK